MLMSPPMSKTPDRMIAGITAGERDCIFREMDIFLRDPAERRRGFSAQDLAGPTPASRSARRSRRD